jgi:hypothetical protein
MKYYWDENTGCWQEAAAYTPIPRVHIIGDTVRPMRSMADGKLYDSKSKYKAEVKALGYEIVGDQRAPNKEYKPVNWKNEMLDTARDLGYGDLSQG